MTLLVLFVVLAVGVSFCCSILEAVLLSVTPAYVARLEQDGKRVGATLRDLKEHVDRPLAAILSLNTIANTLGAAGAGAQAQEVWGSEAVSVFAGALTFVILIVSEIVPKSLGAMYWRALAPLAARVLSVLIFVLSPLVWLSMRITSTLGRRRPKEPQHEVREELGALAQLRRQQGIIEEGESRILANLLRMSSVRTHDIMTPRTVVFSFRKDTPIRTVLGKKDALRFSRYPIWGESEDDVIGYVLKDDVLLRAARDELDVPVGELKRDILCVPASLPVTALFDQLVAGGEHIALAVDEYGGVEGVVSMEDVVETLLGLEIVDEADAVQDMREVARKRWYARAKRLGLVSDDDDRSGRHVTLRDDQAEAATKSSR